MRERYLVYIYESGGLRPITSAKNDPITNEFLVPEPTSISAYPWLRDQLKTEGTSLNHFYDGIVIAVDEMRKQVSGTIAEEAVNAGFARIQSDDDAPETVVEALKTAGFKPNQKWLELLVIHRV